MRFLGIVALKTCVDVTKMRETGDLAHVFYIWSWTVFPANRRMNLVLFTNYGFAQNWRKKVT